MRNGDVSRPIPFFLLNTTSILLREISTNTDLPLPPRFFVIDRVSAVSQATAKTLEEAKALIETGFGYVRDMETCKLFRKRKQKTVRIP
jgi:hypothetical protein